ncbi:MAG: universal stress protein [Caldimicrobium sp.]
MSIKRVLYAVSYWELGYKGLLELLALKKTGLEEIVLLHVIPREEVSYVPFGGFLKEKALELTEAAKLKFEEWVKDIEKAGLKSKIVIEIGDPLAKILEVAEDVSADLLTIGKQKSKRLSISEMILQLINRTKIPVLVYCHSILKEPEGPPVILENVQIFRKPLLATDFSENSLRARDFLLNFKPLIETFYIVHIIKSEKISGLKEEEIQGLEEKLKRQLTELSQPLISQELKSDTFLGLGEDPAREILEFARVKEATLIVLGKTGKGFFEKFFMGSVTSQLLKAAEFPLLIIP